MGSNDVVLLNQLKGAVERHRSAQAAASGELKALKEQYQKELAALKDEGIADKEALEAAIASTRAELEKLGGEAAEYIRQVDELCRA